MTLTTIRNTAAFTKGPIAINPHTAMLMGVVDNLYMEDAQ
jgi:hypothetical protein